MKIFCIGRNYSEHAKEMKSDVPNEPVIFMKPPTALLRNGNPFYLPDFSDEVHHEVEIIVKISKNGKHIDPKSAREYYDEISVGIDFTARDLQAKLKQKGLPWELSKGFDFSAGIGNWIEFTDEMKSKNLSFHLDINDKTVQKGSTSDMIFSIDNLIAYISKYFKIQVGDIIFTGTPVGVSKINSGDVLEAYLEDEKLFYCEVR